MKIGSYELHNHGHRGFSLTGSPLTLTVAHTDHLEYTFVIPSAHPVPDEESNSDALPLTPPWTYGVISYYHETRHYDFSLRQGSFSHYEKITTTPRTIYLVNDVIITFGRANDLPGDDFILAYDEWIFSDQHFFHQDGYEITFPRDGSSLTITNP